VIGRGEPEIWSRDGSGTEIDLTIPAASVYTAVRRSAQCALKFLSTARWNKRGSESMSGLLEVRLGDE
jgi:hypothetical protein